MNKNKYKDMVRVIADSDRTQFERADILIREMCKLTSDLLDYRYASEHYKGDGNVIDDRINAIKNSLALIVADVDIYMEQMNITKEVRDKAAKRMDKLVNKLEI